MNGIELGREIFEANGMDVVHDVWERVEEIQAMSPVERGIELGMLYVARHNISIGVGGFYEGAKFVTTPGQGSEVNALIGVFNSNLIAHVFACSKMFGLPLLPELRAMGLTQEMLNEVSKRCNEIGNKLFSKIEEAYESNDNWDDLFLEVGPMAVSMIGDDLLD